MQQQNNNIIVLFSSWQRDIYSALYMLGMLFGSYFFGWVSDKYGRKNALMASIITVSIAGFLGYDTFLAPSSRKAYLCSFVRFILV